MQVYSLAIIVLTMVYSDKLNEEALNKDILQLRERYSYELSCLIEEMIRKDERERISLKSFSPMISLFNRDGHKKDKDKK